MVWNVWMSEGSVLMSFVTMGSAIYWTSRSHRWMEQSRQSNDPLMRAWLPRWQRVHRLNVIWLVFTVLLVLFQIRMHLFQIGAMPMPFK